MREIKLTNTTSIALVDDEDYTRVIKFKWYLNKTKGFIQSITQPPVYLHRFILNVTDYSKDIDHKDGDGLNNQKNNIRICSHAENLWNRKHNKNNKEKLKGISKKCNGYTAQIMAHRKSYYLGFFKTKLEAAVAYDLAALRLHGEFACINFPIPKLSVDDFNLWMRNYQMHQQEISQDGGII